MSEKEALRQLKRLLSSYTIGSACHLLMQAYRERNEDAGLANDPVASGKCDIADHVLFTVGVGLDAALPQ